MIKFFLKLIAAQALLEKKQKINKKTFVKNYLNWPIFSPQCQRKSEYSVDQNLVLTAEMNYS